MLFAERKVVEPILQDWLGPSGEHSRERCRQWLDQRVDLSGRLKHMVPELIESAVRGRLDHLAAKPRGSLTLVLLLDTFPRILWRGQERAYSGDAAAQAYALRAMAQRLDRRLPIEEQLFLYLPLMHAEDLQLQKRAWYEYDRLSFDAPEELEEIADGFYQMALDHHAIIKEFGRFPDRNAALHRRTSADERVLLYSTHPVWFDPQPRTGETRTTPF